MIQPHFVVMLCTSPREKSEKIARALVEDRLAACVNISSVMSYFRWDEELCDEKEDLLIIKTERRMINEITERIKDIHSYELPEVIVLPIIGGYDKYLEWVAGSIRG